MTHYEEQDNIHVIRRVHLDNDAGQLSLMFEEVLDKDQPCVEQVIDYYTQVLMRSERANDFLRQRGIYHPKAIQKFRLGYADRTLGLQLQKLKSSEQGNVRGALQRSGLLKPSGHEFFRGSLVFPLTNQKGEAVGAYGRRVTDKLKANSVYHVQWTTDEATFFNWEVLKSKRQVVLCKNPLEALSWWVHGFSNVISLVGTLQFSVKHRDLLKRMKVECVIVAFGGSVEEQATMRRIAEVLLPSGIQVRFVLFPFGYDSNAFVLSVADPKDALNKLLASTMTLLSQQ